MEKLIIIQDKAMEERSKARKEAIDNLEYNPICYNCKSFKNGCTGTKNKVYSGCVYREVDESKKSIYQQINESIA